MPHYQLPCISLDIKVWQNSSHFKKKFREVIYLPRVGVGKHFLKLIRPIWPKNLTLTLMNGAGFQFEWILTTLSRTLHMKQIELDTINFQMVKIKFNVTKVYFRIGTDILLLTFVKSLNICILINFKLVLFLEIMYTIRTKHFWVQKANLEWLVWVRCCFISEILSFGNLLRNYKACLSMSMK